MSERLLSDDLIVRNRSVASRSRIGVPSSSSAASISEEGARVTSLDFLDFYHPVMRIRAQERGFENGRVFIDPSLYGFLVDARESGAIEKVLSSKSPEDARKVLGLAWFYTCTDAYFSELMREYGYRGRNGPRDLVIRFIKNIHRNSSKELRDRYPEDKLNFGKKTTQRHLDMQSQASGGKRVEVRQLIEFGETDFRKIAAATGLAEYIVINMMVAFRKQGVLHETKRAVVKRVRAKVAGASSDQEYRAILNAASDKLVRVSPDFSSLSRILRDSGYSFSLQSIPKMVRYLAFQNVPMRNVKTKKVDSEGNAIITNATYFLTGQRSRVLDLLLRSKQISAMLKNNDNADPVSFSSEASGL